MEAVIKNNDILFPSFLEDQRVYNLAEAYWRRRFDALFTPSGIVFYPFYSRHFGNGQKIYDGNPIFDAYFPAFHKLIRILQYLPEPGEPLCSAWTDSWPIEEMNEAEKPSFIPPSRQNQPIPELVLDLALTSETRDWAERLIRAWIIQGLNKEDMKQMIGV